jgi:hypothetical protein
VTPRVSTVQNRPVPTKGALRSGGRSQVRDEPRLDAPGRATRSLRQRARCRQLPSVATKMGAFRVGFGSLIVGLACCGGKTLLEGNAGGEDARTESDTGPSSSGTDSSSSGAAATACSPHEAACVYCRSSNEWHCPGEQPYQPCPASASLGSSCQAWTSGDLCFTCGNGHAILTLCSRDVQEWTSTLLMNNSCSQ